MGSRCLPRGSSSQTLRMASRSSSSIRWSSAMGTVPTGIQLAVGRCFPWTRGAAITEIDAIPLRGRRSLITAPVSSRFAAVLLTSQYGNQLGLSVEIMREPRNRTGFLGEDTPTQRGALRWEGQPDVRTRVWSRPPFRQQSRIVFSDKSPSMVTRLKHAVS